MNESLDEPVQVGKVGLVAGQSDRIEAQAPMSSPFLTLGAPNCNIAKINEPFDLCCLLGF